MNVVRKWLRSHFNPHCMEYFLREYRNMKLSQSVTPSLKAEFCRLKLEVLFYFEQNLVKLEKKYPAHKDVIKNAKIVGDQMVLQPLKNEMIAYSLKHFNNAKNFVYGFNAEPRNNHTEYTIEQLINLYKDSVLLNNLKQILNVIDTYLEQYNKH